MIIEEEIQKTIDDFVGQIEQKEDELLSFNKKVQEILTFSKQELDLKIKQLESDFSDGKISENEYRNDFLNSKEKILKETKENLDILIGSLSSDEN